MKRVIIFTLLTFTLITSCKKTDNKADGYGNFDAPDAAIISAQTSGIIKSFNVEEGNVLKADEILGFVDTTTLHLQKVVYQKEKESVATQLKNIAAALEVQKQQLFTQQQNQKRIKNLYKNNAATKQQLDNINGAVALIQKQMKATQTKRDNVYASIGRVEAQIGLLNENIQKSILKNPVSGTVLIKYAQTGELAVPGKPLYQIANLKTMNLNAFVTGSQLHKIKLGQKVKVFFDKNKTQNIEIPGRVIWISSQAEFTPKTIQTKQERVNLVYAIKIEVKNKKGEIKIGMPGDFRLH